MATAVQTCDPFPTQGVTVTADDVERFSGKRPLVGAFELRPVDDPGAQYELALDFDDDDEDDGVNPVYGIPQGVSMLMACDGSGDPAGFITFRRALADLDHGRMDPGGRRRLHYAFHIQVFMVRPDLRGQGFGSALAIGALRTMRDDLAEICRLCPYDLKPEVDIEFVGEGKSPGGMALLGRVAANLGLLSDEVYAVCRSDVVMAHTASIR